MLRRLGILAGALVGAVVALLGGWYLLRKARPLGPLAPHVEANIKAFDLPDAELYDREVSRFLCPVYRAVARDLAEQVPRGPLLDVGAGPGHLVAQVARLRPELDITGVDLMPEMVRLARQRAARAGLEEHLSFREGDVGELPFEDESFAIVTSSFSMHHWEEVRPALREIERVLAPGGRAIIYDLPGWFLRLAAHAADPGDPHAADIFAEVRDSHLPWPLGIPFIRRLELSKSESPAQASSFDALSSGR